MSIIRTIHDKDNPYFILNRSCLNEKDLSFRAKGIHSYLMSKPDNWQTNITELGRASTEGRDAVRTAMNELVDAGYVARVQSRDDGKFGQTEMDVHEVPCTENPLTGKPQTDSPDTGNPTLMNIDLLKSNKEESIDIVPPSAASDPEATKPHPKDHPAVKAYKEIFHRSMKRAQYPHVQHIDDIDKWTAVLTEWLLRSYNPTNLSGQLDWYRKGIPQSYKRKQAKAQEWDTSRQDHPGWTKDWSHVQVKEDYDHESINF